MEELSNPMRPGIIIASISVLFAIFHILVITGIVPDKIVWGGRMQGSNKLVLMESISILIILLSAAGGLYRARLLAQGSPNMFSTIVVWIFGFLFALNTLGNIFAQSRFERIAFTPITAALAILFIRLAIHG